MSFVFGDLDLVESGSMPDSGDICSICFSCILAVLFTPGGGEVFIGGGGAGPSDMTGVAIGSLLAISSAISLIDTNIPELIGV